MGSCGATAEGLSVFVVKSVVHESPPLNEISRTAAKSGASFGR